MKDIIVVEKSSWEQWRDEKFNPVARQLKGSQFGTAQLMPQGMRIELIRDIPKEERRKLEALIKGAGPLTLTTTSNKDILFVRRG